MRQQRPRVRRPSDQFPSLPSRTKLPPNHLAQCPSLPCLSCLPCQNARACALASLALQSLSEVVEGALVAFLLTNHPAWSSPAIRARQQVAAIRGAYSPAHSGREQGTGELRQGELERCKVGCSLACNCDATGPDASCLLRSRRGRCTRGRGGRDAVLVRIWDGGIVVCE